MKAVVAGATGLVGRALVDVLRERGHDVTAVARRELEGVTTRVVDFSALSSADVPQGADAAFCALGTTIRVAGSQEAFREVDHGHVMRFARACREAGVRQFHVVSALGADAGSRVFYNRVKGEMERDVAALDFPVACSYRPSLLVGDRLERRPGERAGLVAARVLDPLIPRRWKAVPAHVVAGAMVHGAEAAREGWRVVESGDMWPD